VSLSEKEQPKFFVGIDLGGEEHKVCLIAGSGELVEQRCFAHSGAAIGEFLDWLQQRTVVDPSTVAIAVEAPRGVVMEALLERRYAVFSINPKQLDRFRDRFSVAGAKDDRRDAFVLAHSLRTDGACFSPLSPEHPKVVRLRELSRSRDEAGEELRRVANQLNDALRRYFPSLLTLCPGSDELWLWTLLRQTPLPCQAARLSRARLEKLLRQHRIRRFSADDLYTLLRAPALPMTPGSAEAIAEKVTLLLPRLVLLHQQKSQLDNRIDQVLQQLASDENYPEHRDVTILRSVPGLGRGFVATVLSEAPRALAKRDYRALRGLAGIAPVTKQSGKTKLVTMRQACNRRLRVALHHSTTTYIQHDERARRQYAELRHHGHSHGRAIRGVADRLLALIIAMLQQQTTYDPERRKVASMA
jgi:transposase